MDDLLLFTKCSPFADVWRLYADNPDLVALFKIEDCHREECLKQLPNSFTVCNMLRKLLTTFNIIFHFLKFR